MKFLAAVTLIIFALMALVSFAAMSADHTGPAGCLATAINNGACPDAATALSLASFHASAYRFFSTALITVFALLFVAFVFLFFVAGVPASVFSSSELCVSSFARRTSSYQRFRRFLSRFETSPTL